MNNNILNLYPNQFQKTSDRRQKEIPVEVDRRSGIDRRAVTRINLPNDIESDLNNVKSKVDDIYSAFQGYNSSADITYYKSINNKKKIIRKTIFSLLSPIVPFRRISSLPDNIEDGNYERAAGLIALAVVNLPEDTRDLKAGARQILSKFLPRKVRAYIAKKNRKFYKNYFRFKPKYDYKEFQAPFSFFRGTLLQKHVNKMGRLGAWLYKNDKTLYDTKLGMLLRKKFKIKILEANHTNRFVTKLFFPENKNAQKLTIEVMAFKIEGNKLVKLVGRLLLRIPAISVLVLGLLELPSIIKSFNKSKKTKDKIIDGGFQIIKSGTNVVSILSGIGIVGTFLARKGPAGSLIGMGTGSIIGSYISQKAGEKMDDLKEKIKT